MNSTSLLKLQKNKASKNRQLSKPNRMILNGFFRFLQGKRYSKSTVNTYTYLIADLVEFYNDKTIGRLNNRDIEVFIEQIMLKKSFAISTHRQFISALKQFCTFYPSCKIEELKLIYPRKSKKLPIVLSQKEVINLLQVTKNLKHRAILALIYSAGLRISELINLELTQIHIDRKQLVIKYGKERKDRYIVLADSFLPLLKNYFITYQPKRYFAEGPKHQKYSASSIRKFLWRSCQQAKIYKHVTPHTLRHSYATHLLENGIGLRYIQELLGHSKPETTMIYTHVARKDLLDIQSPLDLAVSAIFNSQKGEQNFLISGKK